MRLRKRVGRVRSPGEPLRRGIVEDEACFGRGACEEGGIDFATSIQGPQRQPEHVATLRHPRPLERIGELLEETTSSQTTAAGPRQVGVEGVRRSDDLALALAHHVHQARPLELLQRLGTRHRERQLELERLAERDRRQRVKGTDGEGVEATTQQLADAIADGQVVDIPDSVLDPSGARSQGLGDELLQEEDIATAAVEQPCDGGGSNLCTDPSLDQLGGGGTIEWTQVDAEAST